MATFAHPTLGEITLHRSTRSRRVSLSVKPSGEVRLTLPQGTNETDALAFLNAKSSWVTRARERMQQRHPKQLIELPYATRHHILRLNPCACLLCSAHIAGGVITLSYPMEMHYEAPHIQASIHQAIEEAWRIEAKAYLPERVQLLCTRLGMRCGKVTIRNTRTRWGSCSPTDDLSLSVHLMKLPDHLIDYVLIHELCHTLHKNHGPRFHALLDKLTGERHQALRRELKTYSTRW